jgi:hypothetical protein
MVDMARANRLSPCVIKGAMAGVVAGAVGGLPSILLLSSQDLNSSIRAAAHLVPGAKRVHSPAGRWAVGATAHMSLSVLFAVTYFCLIKRAALAYGATLWLVNTRIIAPAEFRREDRSYSLADHMCWAAVLHIFYRVLNRES